MQQHTTHFGRIHLWLVLTATAFFVLALGWWLLQTRVAAQVRDMRRLSDMRIVAARMLFVFARTGSYQSAAVDGCATVGDSVADCQFAQEGKSLATLHDPGTYVYRVTVVPATTYAVEFRTEQRHGTFLAGLHTLTPEGIR